MRCRKTFHTKPLDSKAISLHLSRICQANTLTLRFPRKPSFPSFLFFFKIKNIVQPVKQVLDIHFLNDFIIYDRRRNFASAVQISWSVPHVFNKTIQFENSKRKSKEAERKWNIMTHLLRFRQVSQKEFCSKRRRKYLGIYWENMTSQMWGHFETDVSGRLSFLLWRHDMMSQSACGIRL